MSCEICYWGCICPSKRIISAKRRFISSFGQIFNVHLYNKLILCPLHNTNLCMHDWNIAQKCMNCFWYYATVLHKKLSLDKYDERAFCLTYTRGIAMLARAAGLITHTRALAGVSLEQAVSEWVLNEMLYSVAIYWTIKECAHIMHIEKAQSAMRFSRVYMEQKQTNSWRNKKILKSIWTDNTQLSLMKNKSSNTNDR